MNGCIGSKNLPRFFAQWMGYFDPGHFPARRESAAQEQARRTTYIQNAALAFGIGLNER